MRLREIAERLGCRLEGNGDLEIRRVAGVDWAEAGDLTFVANARYFSALPTTRASAVILGEQAPPAPCSVLRAADPYLAFAQAVELFVDRKPVTPGLDRLSTVAEDATIKEGVAIGPFVAVGSGARIGARTVLHPHVWVGPHVEIGADCIVHSHVAVRERVRIGNRVVIQNGAVIGSDGFGFARRPDGTHQKIPQVGIVIIEDDVEIGANTTIDRPAIGETRVGTGTKIDNLVQIAHGVTIGRNVLLAAQVGIAGTTSIEDNVVLAGQVGVAGHLTIGRGASATAQSGIPNSVPAGAMVSGYPAISNREWLKAAAVFRKLPAIRKAVVDLETRLAALEARLTAARKGP